MLKLKNLILLYGFTGFYCQSFYVPDDVQKTNTKWQCEDEGIKMVRSVQGDCVQSAHPGCAACASCIFLPFICCATFFMVNQLSYNDLK